MIFTFFNRIFYYYYDLFGYDIFVKNGFLKIISILNMLMNLFWTSWIPERFCLNGLIARRIYSSLAETRLHPEYRLGQVCFNGNSALSMKTQEFVLNPGQS